MATLIELQPAFLLHARPFRDNSFILDFFAPDLGRVSAIARGGRGAKSKNKSLLQPFIPLHISLSGKHDLKTLRTVELRQSAPVLKGERLFSAMYMNEIIVRLFHGHEADPGFFRCYEQALFSLGSSAEPEAVLREFELALLDALGYGVDFSAEGHTHLPLSAEAWYCFEPERGLVKVQLRDAVAEPAAEQQAYAGQCLLAIHERDFTDSETRRTAKLILRQILNSHLGPTPVRSRSLFARP